METSKNAGFYRQLASLMCKAVRDGEQLDEIIQRGTNFCRQKGIFLNTSRQETDLLIISLIIKLYMEFLSGGIRKYLKTHHGSGGLMVLMLDTINIFLQAHVIWINKSLDAERRRSEMHPQTRRAGENTRHREDSAGKESRVTQVNNELHEKNVPAGVGEIGAGAEPVDGPEHRERMDAAESTAAAAGMEQNEGIESADSTGLRTGIEQNENKECRKSKDGREEHDLRGGDWEERRRRREKTCRLLAEFQGAFNQKLQLLKQELRNDNEPGSNEDTDQGMDQDDGEFILKINI